MHKLLLKNKYLFVSISLIIFIVLSISFFFHCNNYNYNGYTVEKVASNDNKYIVFREEIIKGTIKYNEYENMISFGEFDYIFEFKKGIIDIELIIYSSDGTENNYYFDNFYHELVSFYKKAFLNSDFGSADNLDVVNISASNSELIFSTIMAIKLHEYIITLLLNLIYVTSTISLLIIGIIIYSTFPANIFK